MDTELITYTTKELSFFKRLLSTGKFPPSKNRQLKQITFSGNNVSITMRSGNFYELKKGKYRTIETVLGIAEDNYNIKITTLTKPEVKINICGFDGELTPEEWEDIKRRLNYQENETARKYMKKGLEIVGDLL